MRNLAENNVALAQQVARSPFMEPPFLQRDAYALETLYLWSIPESESIWSIDENDNVSSIPGNDAGSVPLAQLASRSWFEDGLDDLEAALLACTQLEHR